MAISVTHTFVSPVADAGNPDEVGPSEWNAAHTISGLGTAAEADSTDFATAAQGALADSAVQPGDVDALVSANADVAANTAARHAAVTVTDSAEINFTLTGQDITASLIAGSIDESKLDASVNASLDLADSAVQPAAIANMLETADIGVSVQAYDADLAAWAGVNPSSYLNTSQIAAAYQPLDSDLTAIAALSTQTFGRARLTDAEAEDARNALDAAPYVATRTALKALDTTKETVAILTEAGREGIFNWVSSDLSAILTINSQTSTAVDSGTEIITKAGHGYLTGEALVPTASVDGLTAGTVYFAIRVDADTFKVASTWANAMAGTAFNLTGTANVTFKKLLDPEEGVYVVKTADDKGGVNGAWVRADRYRTGDLWGAKHDGTTDDTRALNAAALFISVRGETLNLLPGTYFIDTQTASSYAARAIGNYNITIQSKDGWRIIGTDRTVFTTGVNGNYAHIFFFMDCDDFEFGHVTFVGNNTGLGGSDNNGALFPYSCNNFHIHDIKTSVFQGSHIVGNFWFNSAFERVYQSIPAAASGFDCASIQNVLIDQQLAIGAGTGSGQGFQHSYDTPNANPAFNTTGVTLRNDMSNNFTIRNGDYSGFATGVAIFDANDYWVHNNNIHDNYVASGSSIYGMLAGPTVATAMFGGHVLNNTFRRNGSGSGTAALRAGLFVNSNLAAVEIDIRGNRFFDNFPNGVSFFAAACTALMRDNKFGNITGSDQASDYVGTPLLAAETLEVADAATNTISTAQKLSHSTSGTAAAGLGVGQEFEVESAAGTRRVGARIDARLNTATDAAENFSLDFWVMKAGAAVQRFYRMLHTGLFSIGDVGIAGIDFGVNLQSAFPQSWQYNVSAANGNLYFFDGTNTKFPLTIQPNVADNALVVAADITSTIGIKSSSATRGIGYATGAGGTVTQLTSKATGVTLSKASGQITTHNAALAAATIVSFVLTNTAIAAGDVLVLNHVSGGTLGAYTLNARCGAGSATIDIRNNTAGSLSDALVIGFALIKAVTA